MIIPGFDRIEGTAVNPTLLNSDELWFEHTNELNSLLEEENEGKSPEDCLSMMEFGEYFANGSRTTLAMRRAATRLEWKIDEYAVKLSQNRTKAKLKNPQSNEEDEYEEHKQQKSRKRNSKRSQKDQQKSIPEIQQFIQPGIVVTCGAGFPYDEENTEIRTGLKRLRDLLAMEGFYLTPEHAHHFVLSTLQEFKENLQVSPKEEEQVNVDELENTLRESKELKEEINKGPIRLIANGIEIVNGESVAVVFHDQDNRLQSLRNILASTVVKSSSKEQQHVVQCIIARVTSFPSTSKDILIQKLEGIVNGISVQVNTFDVVVEENVSYLVGFPAGVIIHWDLLKETESTPPPTTTEPTKKSKTNFLHKFLEKDESAIVAMLVVVLSFAAVWWKQYVQQ